MFEVIVQIVICLVIAALIGGVIGYLIGKKTSEKIDNKLKEKTNGILEIDKSDSDTNIMVGVAPLLLLEAREGEKDNLQYIDGIGAVLEKLLNEIGIFHFEQIANLNEEEVVWLDQAIAFPGRIEREEWIKQAKKLNLA